MPVRTTILRFHHSFQRDPGPQARKSFGLNVIDYPHSLFANPCHPCYQRAGGGPPVCGHSSSPSFSSPISRQLYVETNYGFSVGERLKNHNSFFQAKRMRPHNARRRPSNRNRPPSPVRRSRGPDACQPPPKKKALFDKDIHAPRGAPGPDDRPICPKKTAPNCTFWGPFPGQERIILNEIDTFWGSSGMGVRAGSAKTRMRPPPSSPEPESEAYGPVFFVPLWLGVQAAHSQVDSWPSLCVTRGRRIAEEAWSAA